MPIFSPSMWPCISGNKSSSEDVAAFKRACAGFGNEVAFLASLIPLKLRMACLKKWLKIPGSCKEAGKIYRHIEKAKGTGNFITEISMDEVETPQTPVDMFFILKMISEEAIPAQTIAPKFTGTV
jgi:tagaturonate epimerase